MKDPYRLALPALILIVVLRMSIGWQLLYEGLWKVDTLNSPKPWTSAGYLKNSQGPLRDFFRNLTGDPDELGWLDYDTVAARWDDWRQRFDSHYGLDKKQSESLRRLLEGSYRVVDDRKVYISALEKLPEGIDDLNQDSGVSKKVIWFNPARGRLYVDAELHMKPRELTKLQRLVDSRDDPQGKAFLEATQKVFERQKRGMGYKEKLAGALIGDPELVGNEDWQRVGRLKQYREGLVRYENARAKADQDFEWDHLDHTWKKLQELRGELTAPIKSLEDEMKEEAESILTLDQIALGPPSKPWTTLRIVDYTTIFGLTVLGTLLLLGLGSRLAALLAAVMLFNFYLAMPPLPGLPSAPGPEHSLFINKNLIEVIALLGIAAMPTGRWFGVDALVAHWFNRRRQDSGPVRDAASATSSTDSESAETGTAAAPDSDHAEASGDPAGDRSETTGTQTAQA